MQEHEPVLCFVNARRAYFTTQPLSEPLGDDWFGVPYADTVELAWEGNLLPPDYGGGGRPWRLQDVNAGLVPWLVEPKWEAPAPRRAIRAGATIQEFKDFVQACGGKVYEEAT